jgi:TRAP-type C4-dicarboxylate transport system substrate-binding protein
MIGPVEPAMRWRCRSARQAGASLREINNAADTVKGIAEFHAMPLSFRSSFRLFRYLLPIAMPAALVAAGLLTATTSAIATQEPVKQEPAKQAEPIVLRIVGGLGGVRQYSDLEAPFWQQRLPHETGGRISGTIHPFDRSGLRGQEMLQLISLGVVPFGTALLALVGGDEPELGAMDLPGLNPDVQALREVVDRFRPRIERILAERYSIELLGVYTYPAQVMFCREAFTGLDDLKGRRIRTSSVGQSEFVAAVGAIPVITPFAELVDAVKNRVVDCAITGTLSGHQIGLSQVTTHIHEMSLSWGLSFFGANSAAWSALPDDVRQTLRTKITSLESDIWEAAQHDTQFGIACATGAATQCGPVPAGRMTRVPTSANDIKIRYETLKGTILPRWIERCGTDCMHAWNSLLAGSVGLQLDQTGSVTNLPFIQSDKRARAVKDKP